MKKLAIFAGIVGAELVLAAPIGGLGLIGSLLIGWALYSLTRHSSQTPFPPAHGKRF